MPVPFERMKFESVMKNNFKIDDIVGASNVHEFR